KQVEERRLAGSRGGHQREIVPLRNIEVDPLQDVDALAAPTKHLVQIANRDEGIRHHCCTLTLSPSLSVCGPETTTRSPAETPEITSTCSPFSSPTLIA